METKVQLDQALAELDSLDQLDSQPVETAVATKESDIVSADETAVPIQRMEDDEFAGTMNQLNKFVGTIYEEFGNMSSSLKNVSNYFFEELTDGLKLRRKRMTAFSLTKVNRLSQW